jgi:hypothetical protein
MGTRNIARLHRTHSLRAIASIPARPVRIQTIFIVFGTRVVCAIHYYVRLRFCGIPTSLAHSVQRFFFLYFRFLCLL